MAEGITKVLVNVIGACAVLAVFLVILQGIEIGRKNIWEDNCTWGKIMLLNGKFYKCVEVQPVELVK